MPTTERADVQAAWLAMSRRYRWSLVSDEAALIERAWSECQQLSRAGKPAAPRLGVWRVYGALMYERLRQRDDQAAQELWQLFAFMAMRQGKQREEAQDLAQEAVLRVLTKLSSLKSPASFLTWALRVLGTVRRELEAAEANESKHDSADEHEQADEHDYAQQVEQQIALDDMIAQLRARLPGEFERSVLIRTFIDGDKPRDIAADLGIPMARVRVVKSRVLQRLRDNPAFMAWLRNLSGESARAMGNTGASDHDE